MIIIFIPSHFEAKDLVSCLENAREYKIGEADCAEGRLGETEVLIAIIGMGPPHAPKRAAAVLEKMGSRARGVILCGFAGALHPDLRRGDIFVTAGEEHLLPLLPEAERPTPTRLETLDKIAGTAKAKGELYVRTGAWLCDMEQSYIAEVVTTAGLPFVGIRIVSDEAVEDLPQEQLGHAYDQNTGTYTPWKLAGHLTRNPFRTVPLATFVRLLPPVRTRMTERLHTWLKLTGSRLFRP